MPQPRLPDTKDAQSKAQRAAEVIGWALVLIVLYAGSATLWVVFVRWCLS